MITVTLNCLCLCLAWLAFMRQFFPSLLASIILKAFTTSSIKHAHGAGMHVKPQIKPRFLNLLLLPNVRPTAQCNSPGFLMQLQHFHSRAGDLGNEATLVHAGMQTLVKIDTLEGQGEFSCSVISWWRKFSGRPLMEFWQHIYYVATRSVIKWSIYNPWCILVMADGGWSACW